MSAQNESGHGISHAAGDSKVPGKVQEAEHPKASSASFLKCSSHTGDVNQSTNVSHAKGGGEASIVPQKLQEKLPEGIGPAVPNSIHDTGDESGLHRKQH
ncbi:hypothetical protein B0O99DRAFT_682478 [Bisporella sp. PMI_857]|nr:hypothetical protein B0O99DRAFT_682478 [Bisporella sp. PMI_857]